MCQPRFPFCGTPGLGWRREEAASVPSQSFQATLCCDQWFAYSNYKLIHNVGRLAINFEYPIRYKNTTEIPFSTWIFEVLRHHMAFSHFCNWCTLMFLHCANFQNYFQKLVINISLKRYLIIPVKWNIFWWDSDSQKKSAHTFTYAISSFHSCSVCQSFLPIGSDFPLPLSPLA